MQNKNILALTTFATNLKKIRKSKKHSVSHASFHMGIEYRLLQKYESKNPPDIRLTNLLKILRFYKIDLEELVK